MRGAWMVSSEDDVPLPAITQGHRSTSSVSEDWDPDMHLHCSVLRQISLWLRSQMSVDGTDREREPSNEHLDGPLPNMSIRVVGSETP